MLGSEFITTYARKGYVAWEAAALELARQALLTPWPWVDLPLSNGSDTAVLKVASDVLSVGSLTDYVRLPLTPNMAQSILNLSGSLLTTPWLEYQIYRAAPAKLPPTAMVPNRYADLEQYAAHSRIVDEQIAALGPSVSPNTLRTGLKKGVVIGNLFKTGKVLIFGWYGPPPRPDLFDDHRAMGSVDRQPVQPYSNLHGDFYVDYSHGIRAVAPMCTVNGQPMATAELYTHPTLSRLVSHEGPLKRLRYPSTVTVASLPPSVTAAPWAMRGFFEAMPPDAPLSHSMTEWGLESIARQWTGR